LLNNPLDVDIPMMRVVAIIPAAGQGRRLTVAVVKQYLAVGGMPILARTLRVLNANLLVDGIVLAVGAGQREALETIVLHPYPCRKLLQVVAGGVERQDSVARALDAVPAECEVVVVHDGVRPFVTDDLLTAVIEAAQESGAALAAVPARDTIKLVQGRVVRATLDRETVWLAQTPQAFSADLIRRAHGDATREGIRGTDDAALVERLGVAVQVVLGSEENIKVTTAADLVLAQAILAARGRGGE
jgi:2-C-methyl-D-erythritol 4-phosphate cytidylyltransferase